MVYTLLVELCFLSEKQKQTNKQLIFILCKFLQGEGYFQD